MKAVYAVNITEKKFGLAIFTCLTILLHIRAFGICAYSNTPLPPSLPTKKVKKKQKQFLKSLKMMGVRVYGLL